MSHAQKWYVARRASIDRHLRHQVALPDYMCTRDNLVIIDQFCRDRFGALCETRRVQTLWDDRHQETYRLHCFATREQAEIFAAHFGGEHFDPAKDRDKGKAEGVWRRQGPWVRVERCGVLEIPDFWRLNP
jgi:hypothetical protein